MLVESLMFFAVVLIAICAVYTYQQFKSDDSTDCERLVTEQMAARSCKVVLDLADAYQLPDELGMKKVEAIEQCRAAILQFESDYYVTVEELEIQAKQQENIAVLRTRL